MECLGLLAIADPILHLSLSIAVNDFGCGHSPEKALRISPPRARRQLNQQNFYNDFFGTVSKSAPQRSPVTLYPHLPCAPDATARPRANDPPPCLPRPRSLRRLCFAQLLSIRRQRLPPTGDDSNSLRSSLAPLQPVCE